MFRVHRVWANTLSIKNLILLFFTIVLGFASVITLADITIPSVIDNARQTIGRVTITSDGKESGTTYRDFNSDGKWSTYVHGLPEEDRFSKILWVNEAGNIIYIDSKNLVLSWTSNNNTTTTGSDEDWVIAGNDIYTQQNGNVGIGTDKPTEKLHIVNSGSTDIYIEEKKMGDAASMRLKTPIWTRIIWGDSNPDVFFIGRTGHQEYFTISPLWLVGIWTTGPTAPLQVIGNSIAGAESNQINWQNSANIWWTNNNIMWNNSFIAGGHNNSILWSDSFAGGRYAIVEHNNTFIRNNIDSRFTSFKPGTFLINAPFVGGDIPSWWVGINTNNPQTALDVDWLIRTRPILDPGWCTSETKWAIRFKSTDNHFYGCNGTERIQLDNVR